MKKILVSACLLGEACRYDGGNNLIPVMEELRKRFDVIPFCPEVEGGLPIPRTPAERKGNYVKTKDGKNVTKEYELGAEKALRLCRYLGIEVAILKENSPSCGVHQIHNGRFDGKLIPGKGVTAALLERNGIKVYSEHEIPDFLEAILLKERAKEEEFIAKEEAKKKAVEEKAKKEEEKKKAERKPSSATFGKNRSFGKKEPSKGRKPFFKAGRRKSQG
ncbi:MAG: DUF523 domain-containing protein [Bacilli bacterium]|nr:DUF523 domain-containing protein [Bacilli bacterium]